MSETVYTILDLSRPVGRRPFREVLHDKAVPSPSNTSVQLSEAQLGSLVRVLYTYGMHFDEIREDQRPFFMESIKDNTNGMFDIPLTFCGHLLNNLDGIAKEEFGELLKMEHNLNELFSNEALMDFVEMQLIDPTVTYRKWEYGRYAMEHMSKEFLWNMDWQVERSQVEKKNIPMEAYVDSLDRSLDIFGTGLDDHEKTLLLLLSKNKLWEQHSTLVDHMLFGDIVQSNLVGLNLRKEKLAEALDKSIEYQHSKGKDRGGPSL